MVTVRYAHPKGAAADQGMFFEIQGGPADVDDVSMVPEGEDEPIAAEVATDWTKLTTLSSNEGWREVKGEPTYEQRVPVVVRETAGEYARQHAVSVPLSALFRAYDYGFVSPQTLQVVDSANLQDGKKAELNGLLDLYAQESELRAMLERSRTKPRLLQKLNPLYRLRRSRRSKASRSRRKQALGWLDLRRNRALSCLQPASNVQSCPEPNGTPFSPS